MSTRKTVTGPGAHPNETACEGCIHGAGCRVIPCVDCGADYHQLGLIDPPPFVCWTCEDVRWEMENKPLLDMMNRRPELADFGHGFVHALGVSAV